MTEIPGSDETDDPLAIPDFLRRDKKMSPLVDVPADGDVGTTSKLPAKGGK